MPKAIHYTESTELKAIAEQLLTKYYTVVGYVDLDQIFFAFKGGDISEFCTFEMSGVKNEWLKYSGNSIEETKLYCLAMSYDFYQKTQGPLLQWIVLDLLYCCHPKMNGKLRRKDIIEHSRIIRTIEDIGQSNIDWRNNTSLPELLGDELIFFGTEETEENESI